MQTAQDYINQAGRIADDKITTEIHNDSLSITFPSDVIALIETNIEKAIELDSGNPEYRYFLACAKIARGEGRAGLDEIKKIAQQFPSYIDATGFALNPQQWFSPFYYPSWHEHKKVLPAQMAHLPYGGMSIISLREGCRRVVGFFRHVDKNTFSKSITPRTPIDFNMNFMETPHGTVVGTYILISGKNGNVHINETIIDVGSCPSSLRDLSSCGYWLLRILAQQNYTYIIFNDPEKGIVLNKKLYFKTAQKKVLQNISAKIDRITPSTDWNQDRFKSAQQYYMNHFALDDLFVG